MDLQERIEHNKELFYANRTKFSNIFGINLGQFFTLILGFDIVTFDKFLQVPDGISTKQYITDKYGGEAVKVVEGLL
jgi:hypothetical protein